MSILEVRALCRVYRQGNTQIDAVRDVFLRVEPGEFVAITGTSGSGKSTLLSLMAALLRPTSGSVILDGIDLATASDTELARLRRRRIGFVFQHFDLLPGLTARENIVIPVLLDGRQPDAAQLQALADSLGIADRLDHLPGELSGGQMQRVAIARALINRPAVLLADEPTGNLDSATSAEIMQLLMQRHAAGQTIVMVTHDASIAALANTRYHMADGSLTRMPD